MDLTAAEAVLAAVRVPRAALPASRMASRRIALCAAAPAPALRAALAIPCAVLIVFRDEFSAVLPARLAARLASAFPGRTNLLTVLFGGAALLGIGRPISVPLLRGPGGKVWPARFLTSARPCSWANSRRP